VFGVAPFSSGTGTTVNNGLFERETIMDALAMRRSNRAGAASVNCDMTRLLAMGKWRMLGMVLPAVISIHLLASPLSAAERVVPSAKSPSTAETERMKREAARKRIEAQYLLHKAKRIEQNKEGDWQKQVSQMRDQAKVLMRQAAELAPAEKKSGETTTRPKDGGETATSPKGGDDATKDKSSATPVKPKQASKVDSPGVSSMLSVLKLMPKSLRPDANNGWDKLTLPRVNEWLAKYAKKRLFRGHLVFSKCEVKHIKGRTYRVTATWKMPPYAEFAFQGQTMWLSVMIYADMSDDVASSITDLSRSVKQTYATNHTKAKQWESIPVGKRLDIRGQIASVQVGKDRNNNYICSVRDQMAKQSENAVMLALTRKPKKESPATSKSSAAKAASRVRFAKMYLSSGLKEKAAPILKEVIEKYPNTKAATDAKELLKTAGAE